MKWAANVVGWGPLTLVLSAGLSCCGRGMAAPGSLDPVDARLVAEGTVMAVGLQSDGRVVVGGDFWWLDGQAAPGLARLESGGARDPSFVPEMGLSVSPGWASGGSLEVGMRWNPVTLLPLPDGRLWMDTDAREKSWAVLGSQGQSSPGALNGLPMESGFQVHAEGVSGNHLVLNLITRPAPDYARKAELRAVDPTDGQTIWSYAPTAGVQPLRAWPDGSGRWWVAGEDPAQGTGLFGVPGSAIKIWRLQSNGMEDPALTAPLQFPADSYHLIQPMSGGRLTVMARDNSNMIYTPPADGGTVDAGLYSPEGTFLQSFRTFHSESAGELRSVALPEGGYLTNLNTSPGRIRKVGLDGTVDPAFPPLRYEPAAALAVTSNTRIMINGRRYLPEGMLDPDWTPPAFLRPAQVVRMAPAPGGGIYAAGDFVRAGGRSRVGMVRLDESGVPDEAFQPDYPDSGRVVDLQSLPDGRLVILENRENRPGTDLRVLRILSTGAIDPGFAPFTGLVQSGNQAIDYGPPAKMALFPDGSLLVQTANRSVSPGFAPWRSLTAAGQLDAGFSLVTPKDNADPLVLPDGRFWIGSTRYLRNGKTDLVIPPGVSDRVRPCLTADGKMIFKRSGGGLEAVLPDGAPDAGFQHRLPSGTDVHHLFVDGRGGILTRYASPGDNLYQVPLLRRLRPDGRPDPTFRPVQPARHLLSPGTASAALGFSGLVTAPVLTFWSVWDVLPVAGAAWVAGNFTHAAEQPRHGLLRLSNAAPSGYPEWAQAVFSQVPPDPATQAASADPDHDGIPNALEYATGTDPLLPDAPGSQIRLVSLHPMVLSLPRNPDAPEMTPVLEGSGDLNDWQPVPGSQVSITDSGNAFRFEVSPQPSADFFRVRFGPRP